MAKKILVVDDDRNIGRILFSALQAKGFHPILARNGEEAIEKFEVERPDLVLLDILLPKVSGLDVCKKIKSSDHGKDTPVILMSAIYKSYKTQQEARQKYGADDFIEKPFQISKLLDKIVNIVGEPEEELGITATGAPGQPLMEGELESKPFAFLIHELYTAKETGILKLRREGAKKDVFFKEGYPIRVDTDLEEEYLGNFLVRKRRITLEERNQALIKAQNENKLIGAALIELGILTPEELRHYLRLQLREKLLEIFSWPNGQYQFVRDPGVTGEIADLDMSPANLIYRGIMSRMPIETITEQVDSWRSMYLVPTSDQTARFQELDLTQEETEFTKMIDGSLRVEQVLARSDLDLDHSYRLIYALVATGILELKEQPQATRPLEELEAREEAASEMAEEEATKEEMPKEEIDKRVFEYFYKIQNANALEILGVSDKPTPEEVKQAYFKLAKEFHPDRYHDRPAVVKLKAQEIFKSIQAAYERLDTQEKIDEYLAAMESEKVKAGEAKPEEISVKDEKRRELLKKVIEAEAAFQEAEKHIISQKWLEAAKAVKRALSLQPDEPEYMATLGWALYNLADQVAEGKVKIPEELGIAPDADLRFVAREYINRAIESNPKLDRGYLYLGYIYKRQGLKDMAKRQFEKAIICNPSNAEAQRELRMIKLEAQAAKRKKTLKDKIKDMLGKKLF